ncbi:ParB/Sulfiredoxin [uncultured Caudovirales phage]|uniref:ParB/Sulfiredoxin n=1 Tax=uncultured Caudovirales phage TaxID=2100421 RepID=A0A6J5N6S2_9CAUD|nr:ParB/Sulfiredoxin [uncultured Caudovirales phage]
MKIVKISEVKINPNNPRIIKDDNFKKLVKSVTEFPEMLQLRPIVVNKEMVILGGNMRYKACIESGIKEVPVIIAENLTPEQENEFLIKDNISGGEWDWDVLANEWSNEKLVEWGLNIWETNDDIELTDFFEENGDSEKDQKFKIVLEYSEVDFADITELLKKHSGTKEEIFFNLLSK